MKSVPRNRVQLVDLGFLLRGCVAFIASFFFFTGDILAKPAGCPCSPCTCSPCTCGGHHDHARIGAAVNVDLSGVGRRQSEADPFAVSSGSTTSETHEKSKTKKKETSVVKGNPFTGVKLTGSQAKELDALSNSPTTAVSKP
jgi:hypothetical protein